MSSLSVSEFLNEFCEKAVEETNPSKFKLTDNKLDPPTLSLFFNGLNQNKEEITNYLSITEILSVLLHYLKEFPEDCQDTELLFVQTLCEYLKTTEEKQLFNTLQGCSSILRWLREHLIGNHDEILLCSLKIIQLTAELQENKIQYANIEAYPIDLDEEDLGQTRITNTVNLDNEDEYQYHHHIHHQMRDREVVFAEMITQSLSINLFIEMCNTVVLLCENNQPFLGTVLNSSFPDTLVNALEDSNLMQKTMVSSILDVILCFVSTERGRSRLSFTDACEKLTLTMQKHNIDEIIVLKVTKAICQLGTGNSASISLFGSANCPQIITKAIPIFTHEALMIQQLAQIVIILSQGNKNNKMLFNAADCCKVLIQTLSNYSTKSSTTPLVITVLCRAITTLSSEKVNEQAFGDYDACETLVKVLRGLITPSLSETNENLNANSTSLQEKEVILEQIYDAIIQTLKSMIILSMDTIQHKEKFRQGGVSFLILQILQHYQQQSLIIKEAAMLLSSLAYDLFTQKEYIKQRGYEIIMACLKQQLEIVLSLRKTSKEQKLLAENNRNDSNNENNVNKDCIYYLLQAMVALTDSKIDLEIFQKAERCDILLKIMFLYLSDRWIMKLMCKGIANICKSQENQLLMGNIYIEEEEEEANNDDEHENDDGSAERRVGNNQSRAKQTQRKKKKSLDCCEIIKLSLLHYLTYEEIIIEIAELITKIGKIKNNQINFGNYGIIPLLVKCLTLHSESQSLIRSVCRAIQWITISYEEEFKWKISKGASSPAVTASSSSCELMIEAAQSGNILEVASVIDYLSAAIKAQSNVYYFSMNYDIAPTLIAQNHCFDDIPSSIANESNSFSRNDESNYFGIAASLLAPPLPLPPTNRIFIEYLQKITETNDISVLSTQEPSESLRYASKYLSVINASRLCFAEQNNLSRSQFNNSGGCSILAALFRKYLDKSDKIRSNSSMSDNDLQGGGGDGRGEKDTIIKVLLETILHLSLNEDNRESLGAEGICRSLTRCLERFNDSIEMITLLLPTIKILALNSTKNKIRLGNVGICKECIELLKTWTDPQIVLLIAQTMIPLTEEISNQVIFGEITDGCQEILKVFHAYAQDYTMILTLSEIIMNLMSLKQNIQRFLPLNLPTSTSSIAATVSSATTAATTSAGRSLSRTSSPVPRGRPVSMNASNSPLTSTSRTASSSSNSSSSSMFRSRSRTLPPSQSPFPLYNHLVQQSRKRQQSVTGGAPPLQTGVVSPLTLPSTTNSSFTGSSSSNNSIVNGGNILNTFEIIVEVFEQHLKYPKIIFHLLKITQFISNQLTKDNILKLGQAGCCRVLTLAIARNLSDNVILKETCQSILAIGSINTNRQLFYNEGLCEQLSNALKARLENEELTAILLKCISLLAEDYFEVKIQFRKTCREIAEILKLHSSNKEIIILASQTIALICHGNENNQRTYGETFCPKLLTLALFAHLDNAVVIDAITKAIIPLTEIVDNQQQFHSESCCDALHEALLNHQMNRNTAFNLYEAIKALSKYEINKKRFEMINTWRTIAQLDVLNYESSQSQSSPYFLQSNRTTASSMVISSFLAGNGNKRENRRFIAEVIKHQLEDDSDQANINEGKGGGKIKEKEENGSL